jgi:hypothetical protein
MRTVTIEEHVLNPAVARAIAATAQPTPCPGAAAASAS